MWHYRTPEQTVGPLDFKELRYHAIQRKIDESTEVWTEDDTSPRPASEVEGLLPKSLAPSRSRPPLPPSTNKEKSPYEAPRRRTIMDGPPGGLYLPYLKHSPFSLLLLLLLSAIGLSYLALYSPTEEARLPIGCFAGLAFLGLIVFSYVYLHRAWEMMRVVGAQTSGNQAIKLMALPILNAFTSFRVIFGWSRFWNYQVRVHPGFSTTRAVWSPIFLLFCFGFLASQAFLVFYKIKGEWPLDLTNPLHQASHVVFGVTLLTGAMVWAQFCSAINFLARKKS